MDTTSERYVGPWLDALRRIRPQRRDLHHRATPRRRLMKAPADAMTPSLPASAPPSASPARSLNKCNDEKADSPFSSLRAGLVSQAGLLSSGSGGLDSNQRPLDPSQVRYQTAPPPELAGAFEKTIYYASTEMQAELKTHFRAYSLKPKSWIWQAFAEVVSCEFGQWSQVRGLRCLPRAGCSGCGEVGEVPGLLLTTQELVHDLVHRW